MKKKLTYTFLLLITAIGTWYFFIKEYDYLITFETKNSPGIVYQKLLNWNQGRAIQDSVKILSKLPFSQVELEITQGTSNTAMNWEFFRISDSVSKVKVNIKDQEHSLSERFKFLIGQSRLVKNSVKTVKKVRTELQAHTIRYKVNKPEKSMIPERHCACIKTDSIKMLMKATNMMKKNAVLSDFMVRNNLSIKEFPLLKVTRWDRNREQIDFEFCFPVPKNKEYLPIQGVYLKTFPSRKALKTIFNGNYLISDRAWYHAVDFAQRNQIDIEPNPIEFYYNDPHSGTNELSWVAEIYFPLKDN